MLYIYNIMRIDFSISSIYRTLTIVVLLVVIRFNGMAAPAYQEWHRITLIDGSVVNVTLVGDESFHWYETEDGQKITTDKHGNYIYASHIGENKVVSFTNKRFCVKSQEEHSLTRVTNPQYIGKKNTLVLLINFADTIFQPQYNKALYNDMFNKGSFSEYNHIGSVKDYFYDQSYGKLSISFDVVGPITLSKPCTYYGENSEYGDAHVGEMIAEAITQIKDTIDFSKYDWDGDGYVDQIVAIYAGYGEHSGAPEYTIWPHASSLSGAKEIGDGDGAIELNGVKIDTYIVISELLGKTDTNLSGIGVVCHEFCHTLGLPDLYDTSHAGGFGMKRWSIMDVGNYSGPNGRAEIPCGFSAYERWMMGWLEPVELCGNGTITNMPDIGESATAYIAYNSGNKNEYFMFENRAVGSKWYQYLGKNDAIDNEIGGLLITHIDYDNTAWLYNAVNVDPTHQRMTIIPASNVLGIYNNETKKYSINASQYKGHLYPSAANNNFSETSCPPSQLYTANSSGGQYLECPISNIKKSPEGQISFHFGKEPTIIDTKNVNANFEEETYSISGMKTENRNFLPLLYCTKGKKFLKW